MVGVIVTGHKAFHPKVTGSNRGQVERHHKHLKPFDGYEGQRTG